MRLSEWAAAWGIPENAVADLRRRLGALTYADHAAVGEKSEAAVQQQTRVVASATGARLWRNNNGVAYDDTGRPVRFGLCNDSAALNRKIKSHDLIGITPITIMPQHIGHTAGVFTSYECKPENWIYKGGDREAAQKCWGELIISLGGIAQFITDAGQIRT